MPIEEAAAHLIDMVQKSAATFGILLALRGSIWAKLHGLAVCGNGLASATKPGGGRPGAHEPSGRHALNATIARRTLEGLRAAPGYCEACAGLALGARSGWGLRAR